jgi:AraC-like DNA-binding protein
MQVATFNTEDYPAAERFPRWLEIISQTVSPVCARTDHPDDFRARIRMVDLRICQLSLMSFPSLDVYRTGRLIHSSDPEIYLVALNLRGAAEITQDGRGVELGHTDITIYDSSRPSRSVAIAGGGSHGSAAVMLVPRESVPIPLDKVRQIIATRMSGRHGVGATLLHHLLSLVRHAQDYSPTDAARLAAITVDLLTAALASELDAEWCLPPETRERTLLARIHLFIQQHLADPSLSPQMVAAAHHISQRSLHRLFHDGDSSVAQSIRSRRLERCRHDLVDLSRRADSIQTIAASWGFPNGTQFSRTFRAEFGMSPRQYRQRAASTPVPPGAG